MPAAALRITPTWSDRQLEAPAGRSSTVRSHQVAVTSPDAPAPAELDLGTELVEHLGPGRRGPAELRSEHVRNSLADREALIAGHQQERHPAGEDVVDGARQIVGRRELD